MNLAIESRVDRLLPAAVGTEARAARGVCTWCGIRKDECAHRLADSEARLDLLLNFFGLVESKGAR